jgi:hypothetical protein
MDTPEQTSFPAPGTAMTTIELSASQVQLVRTALEMLEDTLGREEAEELAEVQAILARFGQSGSTRA